MVPLPRLRAGRHPLPRRRPRRLRHRAARAEGRRRAPAADDDPDCAAPAGESEARVPDGAPEAWLFAPGAGPGVTEFGSYDERIAAAKALPPCEEEGEEDDDVECIEGEEPDPPGTPDPDPGRYARQLGEWAKETHKAGLGRWKGVPDEGEDATPPEEKGRGRSGARRRK